MGSQSITDWRGDDSMATSSHIFIPERLSAVDFASEEEGNNSSGSGTGNNSPTLGTSFFGKHTELGNERIKKISIADLMGPHDAQTMKKLQHIRKLSESIQRGIKSRDGNIQTIPITEEDITVDWVRMIINQYKIKYTKSPCLTRQASLRCLVEDCKVSSGEMSTTFKIDARVSDDQQQQQHYHFIAKLLPEDDSNRVWSLDNNVFAKEISIYFELFPSLRNVCNDTKLRGFLDSHLPKVCFSSNNTAGLGVLVFENSQVDGFRHPKDPQGLSLKQVLCVVNFLAVFHAIGSAVVNSKREIRSSYPFLESNVYSSQAMVEGTKSLFQLYSHFLKSFNEQTPAEKFNEHCQGDSGVTQMFSCMRRQVNTPFNTIVHGECWEKNILFKQEEEKEDIQCLVMDWKNAKIASATKDLAFFLMSSTSNELRTERGEQILRTYFATFSRSLGLLQPDSLKDPSLTYENFAQDYKISTKGAFMQSVCVLMQEMQHLESQLVTDKFTEIGETLRLYEMRAKNLMNDKILNETHFR